MSGSKHKRYIGDAVYADYDFSVLVLTTEDGVTVSNRIILEWEQINELEAYISDCRIWRRRRDDAGTVQQSKVPSGD